MLTAKQPLISPYTAPARIPPKAEGSQKTKIDKLYFLHLESPQQYASNRQFHNSPITSQGVYKYKILKWTSSTYSFILPFK